MKLSAVADAGAYGGVVRSMYEHDSKVDRPERVGAPGRKLDTAGGETAFRSHARSWASGQNAGAGGLAQWGMSIGRVRDGCKPATYR